MSTVTPLRRVSTEELIREGATLKARIDEQTKRLREINKELAKVAEFEPGSKTGHLAGAGFKVKVQLRENVSWDQDKLMALAEHMEKFEEVFRPKWEPRSKKALDGFLEFGDPEMVRGIRWAMSTKPGSPQITFESMEG